MRQQLLEQAAQSAAIGRHGMGVEDSNVSLSDIASGNLQIRLMLKTRRFTNEIMEHALHSGDALYPTKCDQHVPDGTCSICLNDIDEGEKIGDLACRHAFHLMCLKDWLRRKNSCPLCLHGDLAYPKTKRKRSIA